MMVQVQDSAARMQKSSAVAGCLAASDPPLPILLDFPIQPSCARSHQSHADSLGSHSVSQAICDGCLATAA